jgi:prevent-host-death family protein
MEITIRELKANLSAVVRRVQGGEHAVVTSHSKPVARLVPPLPSGAGVDDRLVAAGVMLSAPPAGGLLRRPSPVLSAQGKALSDTVIDDRGP